MFLESRYRVSGLGCWIWLRGFGSKGYGVLATSEIRSYAHRYLYEQMVGPVPDGLVLDHLCRNHPCVNPEHLEAVTQHENVRRGWVDRRSGITVAQAVADLHRHSRTADDLDVA